MHLLVNLFNMLHIILMRKSSGVVRLGALAGPKGFLLTLDLTRSSFWTLIYC